ncbi:hypothetical protein K438DRAFT_1769520 [Mycena galopus ATCC 62051]|nr:hypothetical protein K438DRAFT_1769520 [Mycena galopus ATCC 62051]
MGMKVNSKAVFASSSLGQTAVMEEDQEREAWKGIGHEDEPKPYKRNLVISLKKRAYWVSFLDDPTAGHSIWFFTSNLSGVWFFLCENLGLSALFGIPIAISRQIRLIEILGSAFSSGFFSTLVGEIVAAVIVSNYGGVILLYLLQWIPLRGLRPVDPYPERVFAGHPYRNRPVDLATQTTHAAGKGKKIFNIAGQAAIRDLMVEEISASPCTRQNEAGMQKASAIPERGP